MADNFIRIHFRGICTHLVNDSPHSAPQNIGLKRIHDRDPNHRVVLPRSDNVPKDLGIPEHVPQLRFRKGDIELLPGWPDKCEDDFMVVKLKRVALWFDGIDDLKPKMPPTAPALALEKLPSVWNNTKPLPEPNRDPRAMNDADAEKVMAYVDFFGGQHLAIIPSPPFYNEVLATLPLRSTPPVLVWTPFGSTRSQRTPIKTGATIQIANVAAANNCRARDYLLHYRVTDLDLRTCPADLPKWGKPNPCNDLDPVGTDTPYCSSGTYP